MTRTPETASSGVRGAVLAAFRRALAREMHVLRRDPGLLWQQLYNRLQWEDDPVRQVLAPELTRRSAQGTTPWPRTKTPFRESEGLIRILAGHTGNVYACDVGPGGAWIVSASEDKTLKVWDTETGQVRFTLRGHTGKVNACAISPDGTLIVSASDDDTVRTWDPSSGAAKSVLTGHTAAVRLLAVSPDGAWVVSASDDNTVRVWDLAAGTERHVFPCVGPKACAWSPDATWVAVLDLVSGTRTWSTVTGTEQFNLSGGRSLVCCCAVSPDGTWVASGNMGVGKGEFWISDAVTGAERYAVPLPSAASAMVAVCAWSPGATRLMVGFTNGSLAVFEVNTGGGAITLGRGAGMVGPGFSVTRCAWSPDGTGIASGYDDGTLRLWGGTDGAEAHVLEGHTGSVRDCAWSPDGAWLVSASDDGTLRIWDPTAVERARGKSRVRAASHPTLPVRDCGWSPGGAWLASVGDDGTLRIWDGATGAERLVLEHNRFLIQPVNACAWSPAGGEVLTASDDGRLRIWDAISGTRRRSLECGDRTEALGAALKRVREDRVDSSYGCPGEEDPYDLQEEFCLHDCAWSPDGAWVASAGEDMTVRIWDVEGGTERHVLAAPAGVLEPEGHTAAVRVCAWSPDSASLATAGDDRQLIIWDPATGVARHRFKGAVPLAWSPDGAWLASGGVRGGYLPDGTLRIWDAAGGAERHALEGHTGPVNACAWSLDGAEIVSGSEDSTLRIWDAASGTERHVLKGHTGPVHACAWSPDGAWVLSASDDGTLRIWDRSSGHSVLTMCVIGRPTCMAAHPSTPTLAAADTGGTLYLLDLVGIEYGPIIVTAVDFGDGHVVRCPWCNTVHSVTKQRKRKWLGQEISCPNEECSGPLKVNPFVVARTHRRAS